MKTTKTLLGVLLLLASALCVPAWAQTTPTPITVYEFRYVSPANRTEFIRRETTYWAEVAKKALDKGNLTFWAMLERVSGTEMDESPNFLFVNSFNDVDAAGSVWDAKAAFPNLTADKIDTRGNLSTVMSDIFLRGVDFQGKEGAGDDQFNYLHLVFHQCTDADSLTSVEKRVWGPFIKAAMDANKVSEVGWESDVVLSPSGPGMPFNSVSLDIYPTLKDALMPRYDASLQPPSFATFMNLESGPRKDEIYHILKVVYKHDSN